MSIDLQQHARLKEDVDRLRRKADVAQGQLSQITSRLRKEFKCRNIAEAKKLLAKLRKEEQELTSEYEEQLAAFEKEWGDLLF